MRSHRIFTADAELETIGCGLFDRSLPKSEWTHAGHFAAALWVLTCRPNLDAKSVMPPTIRAYNEATGVANTDTGGYHETITQASLRAARAFADAHAPAPLFVVCNALLASPLGDPDWLLAYWSRERLFSVQARRAWVEPDIAALPTTRSAGGSGPG
jgi:hypothetical protein